MRIGPIITTTLKEWKGTAWLLGSNVMGSQLRTLVITLNIVAGIATVACAVAIGFAPLLPGWWQPLAIISAVVGITAFAVFWDGQIRLLFKEGGIGALISLALLVAVIAFPQVFG